LTEEVLNNIINDVKYDLEINNLRKEDILIKDVNELNNESIKEISNTDQLP